MYLDPAIISLIGACLAGGTAWGGAKVALNGTRERVKEIQEGLNKHVIDDHSIQTDTVDRLARIETKLDVITSQEKRADEDSRS